MVWLFLSLSFLLGTITGFFVFAYAGLLGQIAQGLLSIACFIMIIAAFWLYGWKIGLVDLFVVFGGSNLGLSLFKYFVRKSRDT